MPLAGKETWRSRWKETSGSGTEQSCLVLNCLQVFLLVFSMQNEPGETWAGSWACAGQTVCLDPFPQMEPRMPGLDCLVFHAASRTAIT